MPLMFPPNKVPGRYVVALTAKKALPALYGGLPTQLHFCEAIHTDHKAHSAHTHLWHSSTAVSAGVGKQVQKEKGIELPTTLGCSRKSHRSSSVVDTFLHTHEDQHNTRKTRLWLQTTESSLRESWLPHQYTLGLPHVRGVACCCPCC